jgi:hypothetical protein
VSRLVALLGRETALAWGRGGGPLVAVGFYAGVATLLPLAIGPEPQRLAAIATGAAWVALALASLLSLERLFERDYEDGALDLLTLSPTPLELICFVKCLGQWLATGAPLAVTAPVAAIGLGAPGGPARRAADGGDRVAAVRAAGDLWRRGAGFICVRPALARRPGAAGRLCRRGGRHGSACDGGRLSECTILTINKA